MADQTYEFAKNTAGTSNLADDPKIALLAACIADQQRAGFRHLIDLRQFTCPNCRAAGFNSGWGAVVFTCTAESGGDEMLVPCPVTTEEVPHHG